MSRIGENVKSEDAMAIIQDIVRSKSVELRGGFLEDQNKLRRVFELIVKSDYEKRVDLMRCVFTALPNLHNIPIEDNEKLIRKMLLILNNETIDFSVRVGILYLVLLHRGSSDLIFKTVEVVLSLTLR